MQTIVVLTERLDDVVSQLVSTKHDGVALAFLKTAEIDTGDRFPLYRRSPTHQANLLGQKDLLDTQERVNHRRRKNASSSSHCGCPERAMTVSTDRIGVHLPL
jgi:hypothetical protein